MDPARELTRDDTIAGAPRHLTTRRGFVGALSLAGVSLYGLWAAYGAAPLTFRGDGHEAAPHSDGHGGHGAAAGGPSPEEFRRLVGDFIARHRLPDGSVAPDATVATAEHAAAGHDAHAAHGAGALAHPVAAPAEVYLAVQQWFFEPALLRLRAGVPYRFRMMALDVSHGASLQLGRGSYVIRLRPGVLAERELTFTRPGEHLVYCTIYCGLGHDHMSATLLVT
jgi:cytochrome c oxidase subunit II